MGRPPLYESGAMTAAERQRRHRSKVRAEHRQAGIAAKRKRNATKAARVDADDYQTGQPRFSAEQLAELATLLGIETAAMGPLVAAGEAIWRWCSSTPVPPPPGETRDILAERGSALANAVAGMRGLDRAARLAVLKEYVKTPPRRADDDELDLEEALEQASQRRNDASRQFQAQLRAAGNLAQVAIVAARRIKVDPGRPEKIDVRVAAEKIIEAYEKITGNEFVNSTRRGPKGAARRFIMRALDMLGFDHDEASGAINIWRDKHPKTGKKLPRD